MAPPCSGPRSPGLPKGLYPTFLHTITAGLVSLYSPFLEAVLEFYQIQLIHLHANSILILSIFAYLCEAYLGVYPSMSLFKSFYALRSSAPLEQSGCVSFRIVDGRGESASPCRGTGTSPSRRW